MEIKTLELSQLIIVSKLSYLLTALFAKQILVITYITSLFPLQSSRVSLLSFPLDQVGSASSVESVATSCHPPIQLVTCRYLGMCQRSGATAMVGFPTAACAYL